MHAQDRSVAIEMKPASTVHPRSQDLSIRSWFRSTDVVVSNAEMAVCRSREVEVFSGGEGSA